MFQIACYVAENSRRLGTEKSWLYWVISLISFKVTGNIWKSSLRKMVGQTPKWGKLKEHKKHNRRLSGITENREGHIPWCTRMDFRIEVTKQVYRWIGIINDRSLKSKVWEKLETMGSSQSNKEWNHKKTARWDIMKLGKLLGFGNFCTEVGVRKSTEPEQVGWGW